MGKVTGIGEDRYHFLQYKITDGNSDTTETSEDPVVPLFPQFPDSRGHNSQKRGIRAGIIWQSPGGMEEVVFSDVPGPEKQRHMVWEEEGIGRGWFKEP